jgi:hypothetical protein
MEDAPTSDNIGLHAGLCAQHATQVRGLQTNESRGCFIPVFGDPASTCHIVLIRAKPLFMRLCAYQFNSLHKH